MSLDRFQAASGTPARAGRVGQATTIEQARAVAQVQAAVIVAQNRPRDELVATAKTREACRVTALAAQAFFSFRRAGTTIAGPTIRLAEELARCWGNMDYGIVELSRNVEIGESEMLAYAWDLESNMRVSNTFIVPHRRDKSDDKGQPGYVELTSLRDIYENNANQGGRRLRECIFRCLPKYLIEEAETLCRQTLQKGDGTPLVERREKLLAAFHDIGVTRERLERRIGLKADRLNEVDIANLSVIFQSIRRGEADPEEEFPPLAPAGGDAFQQASAGQPVTQTAGTGGNEEVKKRGRPPAEKKTEPATTSPPAEKKTEPPTTTAAKPAEPLTTPAAATKAPAPAAPATPAPPAATAAPVKPAPAPAPAPAIAPPAADPITVYEVADIDGVVHQVEGPARTVEALLGIIDTAARNGAGAFGIMWEMNEPTVLKLPAAFKARALEHYGKVADKVRKAAAQDDEEAEAVREEAAGQLPLGG